jgi:hypothetical protein
MNRKIPSRTDIAFHLSLDEAIMRHDIEAIYNLLSDKDYFEITKKSLEKKRGVCSPDTRVMIDKVIKKVKYDFPERWI